MELGIIERMFFLMRFVIIVKISNDHMTWIPKDPSTNPKDPNQIEYLYCFIDM